MQLFRIILATSAAIILGCNGDDDGNGETLQAEGVITAMTGENAEVAIRKAFGFATNGSALIYMASNENATCDNVIEMFQADEAHNPDQILLAEHCNLIFKFKYDEAAGYDGINVTADDLFSAIWSVSCAMETGAWEYSNNGGDKDFFYTGKWWQGSPDTHNTTVSDLGENIGISTTMGPYSGHFIYQGLDDISATGQVGGTIEAQRCTGLAQTDLFPF